MGTKKFEFLIVGPEAEDRFRLKQATTQIPMFAKGAFANSINECQAKLNSEVEHYDLVFLSYRYGQEQVQSTITAGKKTKAGQDAAYILVMDAKDQQSSTVASSVLAGGDGCLFAPYSVDQLVEITHIAARVAKERSSAREEAAVKFLVSDIVPLLDMVAFLRASQLELGMNWKKLKDTCDTVRKLDAEKIEIYHRVALDVFIEAPIPQRMFNRTPYKGASSRVRKGLKEKIMGEIGETETPKTT